MPKVYLKDCDEKPINISLGNRAGKNTLAKMLTIDALQKQINILNDTTDNLKKEIELLKKNTSRVVYTPCTAYKSIGEIT